MYVWMYVYGCVFKKSVDPFSLLKTVITILCQDCTVTCLPSIIMNVDTYKEDYLSFGNQKKKQKQKKTL